MTVQLEPGKSYVRGDGKVGVCSVNPYRFWIDFGDGEIPSYTTDGKFDEGYDDPVLDIVREVTPEPWRVTETGEHTMRCGEPMWVDAILEKPDADGYQVVGHRMIDGICQPQTWTIDGRWDSTHNKTEHDIMPPCVDAKCEAPKSRPWSRPEDVPMPCVMRARGTRSSLQVLQCVPAGVWCGVNILASWHQIPAYEYSTDGREWRKCEVAE